MKVLNSIAATTSFSSQNKILVSLKKPVALKQLLEQWTTNTKINVSKSITVRASFSSQNKILVSLKKSSCTATAVRTTDFQSQDKGFESCRYENYF